MRTNTNGRPSVLSEWNNQINVWNYWFEIQTPSDKVKCNVGAFFFIVEYLKCKKNIQVDAFVKHPYKHAQLKIFQERSQNWTYWFLVD